MGKSGEEPAAPAPQLGPSFMHDLLETVLLLLAAAVAAVPVARVLGLSSVLGYLIAGWVIGGYALGVVPDPTEASALGEFGIVFMLFTLGLELSIERLRTMRRLIFGLGAAQVLVTGTALAVIGHLLGLPPAAAVIAGAGLALSSTAIVLQTLSERGEVVARIGRVTIAILLFQDLAVAPLLALVPVIGQENMSISYTALIAMAEAAGLVVAIVLIGRFILRHVFRLVAVSQNREVFAALALLVALGTGYATEEVGLSMALGAFLAGILIAETEYRHQVEADIEPYRGIFLGLFFMTVGMRIDPMVIWAEADAIVALVAGIIIIKAMILVLLCRLSDLPLPLAARSGLLLSQGGEFGFVLFTLATDQGVITAEIKQLLVVTVAITMAITPILSMLGRLWGESLEAKLDAGSDDLSEEVRDLHGHVIIAGFGRVGRIVARLLHERHIPYIALDLDAGTVAAARRDGWLAFYGNVTQNDVLNHAKVENARAVVVTIDQPAFAQRVVSLLRADYPDLLILARARDQRHGWELMEAGASMVVPETLEASLQLGWAVLDSVGMKTEDIAIAIDEIRKGSRTPPSSGIEGTAATQSAA